MYNFFGITNEVQNKNCEHFCDNCCGFLCSEQIELGTLQRKSAVGTRVFAVARSAQVCLDGGGDNERGVLLFTKKIQLYF